MESLQTIITCFSCKRCSRIFSNLHIFTDELFVCISCRFTNVCGSRRSLGLRLNFGKLQWWTRTTTWRTAEGKVWEPEVCASLDNSPVWRTCQLKQQRDKYQWWANVLEVCLLKATRTKHASSTESANGMGVNVPCVCDGHAVLAEGSLR